MRERLFYLILIPILSLGLVACSGEEDKGKSETAGRGGTSGGATLEPAPTQDVGGDAAALVPADAHAVVCVRSLDGAVTLLNDFADAIEEPLGADPREFLAMVTGVNKALVDGTRPILAAARMTPQLMPIPTFVLPVTDVDKAAGGAALPFKATRGGYLGMSQAQGYAAGEGSPLLSGLPDGDLVVRLDLAALAKLYDARIQGGLEQAQEFLRGVFGGGMPGAEAVSTVDRFFGFARDIVSSAETLDVVGGAKGGVVDVDLAYTAKEGSVLAKGGGGSALDALAKYVPSDFPVALLFRFEKSTLLEWMRASIEMARQNMPPEERESYGEFMAKAETLFEDLGGDWLFAGKVGKDGLSLVTAGSATDAAGYIAKYLELVKDPSLADIGMSFKDEGERDVAGVKVRRVRITIDGEKFAAVAGVPAAQVDMFVALLFGTGGINLDLAAAGGNLVMVVGREDSLAAAVFGASEPNPTMRAARAEARGDLGFLVHVELRGLVKGIAALAAKVGKTMPAIPDGPPAPLTFYGSRENRTYRFGLHVDAEQVKGVVKALE